MRKISRVLNLFAVFVVYAILLFRQSPIAEKTDSAAFRPNLIFPGRAAPSVVADAAAIDSSASSPEQAARERKKFVVADSARIISPPIRTIIKDEPVTYEIEPLIPVDSVQLFVTHSGTSASKQTDDLGTFASPPYKALWDNSAVADQDQIHLQFGYRLFSGDTLVVTSPAMPHRWMLNRGKRGGGEPASPSKKVYRVKQAALIGGTFDVDGDMSKWANVRGDSIWTSDGTVARFKMLCTGARLHFIIETLDKTITPGDFVELHLDMNYDRAGFADINHRTIRFGPLTKSMSFVAELTGDGFVHADSVNALLNDEKEWKSVITDSGYIIEAAMPFVILSNVGMPRAKFGFNVSVMNDDPGKPAVYYSWTGAKPQYGQYFRYSPSGWGTAKVSQTASALKFMMMGIIFLTCTAVVFFAGHAIFTEHRKIFNDPLERDSYSPVTDAVTEAIEDNLTNAELRIGDIVKIVKKSKEEITAALKKDMDITFEQLLAFKRIKRSQKLMREPETTVENIAEKSGFADVNAYRNAFKAQMKVDPEVSLSAMQDKLKDEERERLEDEEDDC